MMVDEASGFVARAQEVAEGGQVLATLASFADRRRESAPPEVVAETESFPRVRLKLACTAVLDLPPPPPVYYVEAELVDDEDRPAFRLSR